MVLRTAFPLLSGGSQGIGDKPRPNEVKGAASGTASVAAQTGKIEPARPDTLVTRVGNNTRMNALSVIRSKENVEKLADERVKWMRMSYTGARRDGILIPSRLGM